MIISTAKGKRSINNCKCDTCKNEFTRRADYKSFENCISCANAIGGKKRKTHGENNKNSKLHVTWANMMSRCNNVKNKKYQSYGGSGIKVCAEWIDYFAFSKWARSNGYRDALTIDRIDNLKGYDKNNCRFVDVSTQNANKMISDKNTSGFIGVSFQKGAFIAYVNWLGKRVNLGRFKTAHDAAVARDKYILREGLPHTLNTN